MTYKINFFKLFYITFKVKKIAKNPLEAAILEENEEFAKDYIEKSENKKKKKKNDEITYETAILEKTIIKIGALLALGFGEAGSEIIALNMAKGKKYYFFFNEIFNSKY